MPQDFAPAGTVIAFAGNGKPGDNWLLCDGSILKGVQYANLYKAIGTNWGNGDGTAESFQLPDLRGIFLRGWDGGTNNDPDTNTRVAQHNGGQAGDNVGSVQSDAFQGHFHSLSWSNPPAYGGPNNADDGGNRDGIYTTYLSILGPITDGVHGTPKISSETRPKNAYVKYFIKF